MHSNSRDIKGFTACLEKLEVRLKPLSRYNEQRDQTKTPKFDVAGRGRDKGLIPLIADGQVRLPLKHYCRSLPSTSYGGTIIHITVV